MISAYIFWSAMALSGFFFCWGLWFYWVQTTGPSYPYIEMDVWASSEVGETHEDED